MSKFPDWVNSHNEPGDDCLDHGLIVYVSMFGLDGFPRFISCLSPMMLTIGTSVLVCHTYT